MSSRTPTYLPFNDPLQIAGRSSARVPVSLEPSISTYSVASLARRNKYLILAVFGFCLLVALGISELQTPLFRAEALIEIQSVNGNFMKASEYEPTFSEGRTADGFLSTQIRLLKSEALATKVVASTHLNENALYFRTNDKLKRLKQILGQTTAPERESIADTARRLEAGLLVSTVADSDLISIKVDAPDAQLAATLANAFATEYIKQEQEGHLDTSLQTGKMLTGQLEDLRIRLQDSERALQSYAQTAGLLFTDEHSMATDEQLRLVQADLAKAQADRAAKEAELTLLTSATPDSLPKVLDDGPLRDMKNKLSEKQRQLAELSTTLAPKNYKVETVQAEIAALEGSMERERSNVVRRIQNEYNAALHNERLLRAAYENQAKIVTSDSAKAVRYNVLKREVDANRELYSSMLQKVKEASVVSSMHTSSMRLADSARAPIWPYRPNRLLSAGFGSLAGLLCSVLLVLARSRFDGTVRGRGELVSVLEVPELGVIPSAPGDRHRATLALEPALEGPADSLFKEAFNCTATSIFSNPRACKIFLITSPHPREGKSTVAANLARALAKSGRRGILLDGDLRQPTLHSIFVCGRSPGLAEILRAEAPLSAATVIPDIARDESVLPLRLIAAGDSKQTDWSLLQSTRMEALLQELRKQYDFVLIDSPPMLQLTDARILARMADAVVLVCRAGRTRPEQVQEAARLLAVDGSAIFGTILNDWNARTEDPDYLNSYRSYYK
jgi:polysaccharide biosynthesis transport protein